jgi:uridine phosphorylase
VPRGVPRRAGAFYRRDEGLNQRLTDAGVIAAEQECSTVFVVGSLLGVKVGAVLGTDSNIFLKSQPTMAEKEALYQQVEATTIQVAIRAVDDLHAAARLGRRSTPTAPAPPPAAPPPPRRRASGA